MRIRRYKADDAPALAQLFYDTVHAVNAADYSPAQLDAWAPAIPDAGAWHDRMARRATFVAEEGGEPIAFAELEPDGHLDMFYCRKDRVGHGVGARLYEALERQARAVRLTRVFVEASITARPFFERQGFHLVEARTVVRHGVPLANYAMEKLLA